MVLGLLLMQRLPPLLHERTCLLRTDHHQENRHNRSQIQHNRLTILHEVLLKSNLLKRVMNSLARQLIRQLRQSHLLLHSLLRRNRLHRV